MPQAPRPKPPRPALPPLPPVPPPSLPAVGAAGTATGTGAEALALEGHGAGAVASPGLPAYAELHCRSNFSFLTGASHPAELVGRAAQLGYAALALTDECSVAGVVRAHEAAKEVRTTRPDFKLIIGSQFRLEGAGGVPGCRLVLLARNREGYAQIGGLITLGRSRRPKGDYQLSVADLHGPLAGHGHPPGLPDCLALLLPERAGLTLRDDGEAERIGDSPLADRLAFAPSNGATLLAQARWLAATFGDRGSIAIELLRWADDAPHAQALTAVSAATGVPLAAAGDVLMHTRSRKPLQDTLTAIRLRRPIADCGFELAPNAEQHLRSLLTLSQLHQPAWLARSVALAAACRFTLDELRYEYPEEVVPPGSTAIGHLRTLTALGAAERYPAGVPEAVQAQIEKELALVEALRYEAFFLTVHDIVRHARSIGILCQGRGSAANSAVCYCLGITAVDPTETTLLFERFISKERNEPPDIDVDFEHERREEVIQYVYRKYGHHRTALAAALACYRTRSAVRDVGKALGLDEDRIDRLAKSHQWFDGREQLAARLREAGFDPESPVVRQWLELTQQLIGFPRHLSQHVGGFVIARDELSRMVPIENAAMKDRRVIQWDKDDLESLGLLKVDVLALGMLSVIRRSLDLMHHWRGVRWGLPDIPQGDAATYDMACRADTVGVFQIESRAQQSMLPRLQPRCLYDLVIEVAIVRPGPIQGGMVHPFLAQRELARQGRRPPPRYPALEAALKRTLGVPIFQEQVMQICVIAAGFTPGDADGLRRAMAAWRRTGTVETYQRQIIDGMVARGYELAFAEQIFEQIKGFGDYGFPESHAYSFALLAYLSAWLKCHEPAIFLAALLNSQPMGFYSPSQLVQDARRHGVEVRAVDVAESLWDCSLEPSRAQPSQPAVRLGLRMIQGLQQETVERLVRARDRGPWRGIDDLTRRARLDTATLRALARADSLGSLAGHRRQQAWQAAGQGAMPALLADAPRDEQALTLPTAPEGEEITLDYAASGLTLRRHPLALLRPRLAQRRLRSADELETLRNGALTWACGLVVMRQQPETAKGTIFVTLEDETGSVNVIVWKSLRERQRQALLASRLLAVAGQWQHQHGVKHLIARQLVDLTDWLGSLTTSSRDFH